LAYYLVLPSALSSGITSEIAASYQASILFAFASCLFLASSCSSTSLSYLIIFPVRVDLPESTCPMKTILAFYFARKSVLMYFPSYFVEKSFWILI